MNGEQLKAVIDNWLVENPKVDEYDFWYEPDYWLKEPTQMRAEVVTVEVLEHVGGGEDKFPLGGGEIYTVFKVTIDGKAQYFKRTGWYASFSGPEWNKEIVEVFPKEKRVTVYE